MCKHVFNYPPDIKENYNLGSKTLTGTCRYCGAKKEAYGIRWVVLQEELNLYQNPSLSYIDNLKIIR